MVLELLIGEESIVMLSHEEVRVKPNDYKREFEHKGLHVVEIFLNNGGKYTKLVWVWHSIFDTVIDGVANPCFSCDIDPSVRDSDITGRATVEKEFDAYWFDSNGKQTKRDVTQYQAYVANLKSNAT